jgi:Generalcontrol nonderepressible 1 (Gcn1) N-terminal
VSTVKTEAAKGSLAPANYFVLTEWSCVLLNELTQQLDLWSKLSRPLFETLAIALERTFSQPRQTLKHSAIVSTRRVLRRIFRHEKLGTKAVPVIVSMLCNKSSSPTPRNAVLLGVVAGVCARLPGPDEIFASQKKECFTFYIREIIGSRVRLPKHLVEGLQDIFEKFVTLDDLRSEIIPAVEKALLRAPEIVLNDLLSPVINALPADIDLSEVLQKNLLKPLMSNVKSTNAEIRQGALRTFKAVASRSKAESAMDKVVDEILNPLKQNKVTAADQKVIHAEMLEAFVCSPSVVKKIVVGLSIVALKEANETVLDAETRALSKHIQYGLKNNIKIDSGYSEPFVKGLADKRTTVRRIWAIQAGEILWSMPGDVLTRSELSSFIVSIFSKSSDILKEVIANPNTAAQSGLATAAYVFTGLSLFKLQHLKDSNGKDIVSRDVFLKSATIWDGKPSYLSNPRIFTKLVGSTDMKWAIRALISVADTISDNLCKKQFEDSWIQSILYFLVTPSIDSRVRLEASTLFSGVYCKNPERFSSLLINGMWSWLRHLSLEEKDSIAIQSKGGPEILGAALKCICLTPAQREELHSKIAISSLESQMIHLLVLARDGLLPQISWIDLCLKVGIDPGELVEKNISSCIEQIKTISSVGLLPFIHYDISKML